MRRFTNPATICFKIVVLLSAFAHLEALRCYTKVNNEEWGTCAPGIQYCETVVGTINDKLSIYVGCANVFKDLKCYEYNKELACLCQGDLCNSLINEEYPQEHPTNCPECETCQSTQPPITFTETPKNSNTCPPIPSCPSCGHDMGQLNFRTNDTDKALHFFPREFLDDDDEVDEKSHAVSLVTSNITTILLCLSFCITWLIKEF